MLKKLLFIWIFFHLAFIIVLNLVTSYNSYREFNNKKDLPLVLILNTFLNTSPCKYYGRLTGAETGYGFFGINVRSNGLLIGECNGDKLSPDFKSYEASLRFFTLANTITDDLIKPGAGDSINVKDKKSVIQDYYDLVLKNIAVTLMEKTNCADTVIYLSYNLLRFPTLAEVRNGRPKNYTLLKLLAMRYSLHKDEK